MYPRTEYEMTQADLDAILNACQPVPLIMVGGFGPGSQQERANDAWEALGRKMGFDSMTVQPIEGRGQRFFTAIPSETESARKERIAREAEEKRLQKIQRLMDEIRERERQLAALGVSP